MKWFPGWLTLCLLAGGANPCPGQRFEQRGFWETRFLLFPQAAPNDRGRAVGEALLRWEGSYRPNGWLKLQAGFDARTDSHRQFEREFRLDLEDRRTQRPALSLRRFSLTANRGPWTFEAGRQFVRWGKTDLLTPTDRFSPKDFLSVANSDFLAVPAARLTWERKSDTLDLVVQARFTPSRTPLLNQRWTVFPEEVQGLRIDDRGARFPGGTPVGIRWNHVGRGYEFSMSAYDGFNHLPLFEITDFNPIESRAGVRRYFPGLRMYGGDGAVPLRWFTVKAEAAWYGHKAAEADQFVLWVAQVERTLGEWILVGGYGGEIVTRSTGNPLLFAPDRGLAKAFLGRAAYTIDANRSLAVDAAVRQNGNGTLLRFEYSQALGQHWRATAGANLIRGDARDFLGQYRRNSGLTVAFRYSF